MCNAYIEQVPVIDSELQAAIEQLLTGIVSEKDFVAFLHTIKELAKAA